MRSAFATVLFISLCGFFATAQVLPTTSGSCGVSASGLMSCDWLSAPKIRFDDEGKPMIGPGALPGVHVIRYSLAPRAPLYRMAQGRDVLIVAMDEGEIVNEAKTSQNHVSIKNGMVMLMPKKEAYVLRNVGDTDLDLLVIDVTK